MTFLDALILGIIEGLTEFLPVSSTGHLILASSALGIPDGAFLSSFTIAIQLGAISAVVALYAKALFRPAMIAKLFAGFVPTAVIGFLAYPYVKSLLLGNELVVVIALAVGGVVLIAFELISGKQTPEANISLIDATAVTYRQAFLIGIFQSLAIIPGVSRSAATIIGGLSLGLSRVTAVEFSFLLAVPTVAAAVGYDLLKSHEMIGAAGWDMMAIGFVSAFAVALVALKFLIRFVSRFTFVPFGIYRIILALVFFIFIL